MAKWQKFGLITLCLVMCIGTIYFFTKDNLPPADPNADRIAFLVESSFPGLSGYFFYYDIYVTNVDTPGLTHVIWRPRIDAGITWTGTGDKIAYYVYKKGLYNINADGNGQPELLKDQIFAHDLARSPDGKQLAFWDGAGSIYILELATKKLTRLLDDPIKGRDPSWSPSEKQIVFWLQALNDSDTQGTGIAIINMDGSGLKQLTPNDDSMSPDWSPDGSQIAFQRGGNIYIMKSDGTEVKALIEDRHSYFPTWSPDGSRIAFVSTLNQECGEGFADAPNFCTNELRGMDVDGSNVVVIWKNKDTRVESPVWAPRN